MSLIGKPTHQDYLDELYKKWALFSGPKLYQEEKFQPKYPGGLNFHDAYIYLFKISEVIYAPSCPDTG
jgi:hypothetical protein